MKDDEKPLVVVVGASADRRKFGNKAVRGFQKVGWRVIPVNPKGGWIEGEAVKRNLGEILERPKRVSLYVPPSVVLNLLPEIVRLGCDELWFNPGSESAEVIEAAINAGLNVIQACSLIGIGVSPGDLDGEE